MHCCVLIVTCWLKWAEPESTGVYYVASAPTGERRRRCRKVGIACVHHADTLRAWETDKCCRFAGEHGLAGDSAKFIPGC